MGRSNKGDIEMKLSETKGILKKIATAMIEKHGKYQCVINGKKVTITKG
jgi:hypothetical protein